MSICHSLLSLNVRGLRDSKKRREIFRWLKRFHNGKNCIVFLQETHSVENDIPYWEKEWGAKIILSNYKSNSRGVGILLPHNFDFTIDNFKVSVDGRKIILNINYEQKKYCLINVYAPTQDMLDDQLSFFKELRMDIDENLDRKLIIGGDFNICLKSIDNSNQAIQNSKVRLEISQMLEMYDLLDIWRTHHPETKRYTWRRSNPLTQCRLDYWIVGADMSFEISNADIKPSIKTDHSLITIKIAHTLNNKRGKGLWKFNSALLSDEIYTDYMKGIITMHCNLLKDITNNSLKWELIKMEIRNATIGYSKSLSSLKRDYENDLNVKLHQITIDIDQNPCAEKERCLNTIKEELEHINALKTEGYRIRSKAQFIEFNERGSTFFFNLEKRNANLKNITRVKLDDNTEVTESKEILNELSLFYKK